MRTYRFTFLLLLLLFPHAAPLWAEEALTVGIFPRRNAVLTTQLFTPLSDYLSATLNRPVKLVTAKDFASFWEGVEAQRYDLVHYNQYHYIQSTDKYTVIASNQEWGSGEIAGVLYVRRDSGIDTIAELRGKDIIFGGGEDAMMSYIVPRYLLQQGGLKEGDYRVHFASNPPNAVLAVYFQQVTAGGAGDVAVNLPKVKNIIGDDEMKYLAVSEKIKHLPWAVRNDMPKLLQQQIQQLLVNLGENDSGRAVLKAARLSGMSQAVDRDYEGARNIIGKLIPETTQ